MPESRIPNLPGEPVPPKSELERWLRGLVAHLCQLENERFPGSQPVSFGSKDLEKLDSADFWVCEKSDGVRVLLFVQTDIHTMVQDVYLIDRHNSYRRLKGIFFAHHEDPRNPLRNTLVDGELVVDVDPRTKKETLRYLAFDCLVIDDQNVMARPLDKRYGRLKDWFCRPYAKMMKDHPYMAQSQPFEIKIKDVRLSYHVEEVFNVDIPQLQHGNDGLIYTCASTPYIPGTDHNILKWKPPSENSIDFKLVLRFPPKPAQPNNPDFFSKPIFELHVYCGEERGVSRYEMFDVMHVDDDEWERLKASGEQLDDRIVEVHWDPEHEHWRMMRFRDDKPDGNYKTVVDNIIKSIADGIEKEELLLHSTSIRTNWKARQATHPPSHPQPPSQQKRLPPKPPAPTQHPLPARPPSSHALPPRPEQGPQGERLYGPLARSRWSKVAGPDVVAGMYR